MNQVQQILTKEQIFDRAPSVFAEEPFNKMSDRYSFIPTSNILDRMMAEGFQPVRAQQSRSRIPGKGDFTKHMIRFRHQDLIGTQLKEVGQEIPEIVLVNSHDGSSGYQLYTGLFRLVCSNGMVAKSAELSGVSVHHKGNIADNVIEGSYRIIDDVPLLMDKVNGMKAVTLDPAEQVILAETAMEIRYGEEFEQHPFDPKKLLTPKRYYYGQDKTPTLWNTFNNVQENLLKGGIKSRTPNRFDEHGNFVRGRRTTTREIKSVKKDIKINQALWEMAEKMKALKAA